MNPPLYLNHFIEFMAAIVSIEFPHDFMEGIIENSVFQYAYLLVWI